MHLNLDRTFKRNIILASLGSMAGAGFGLSSARAANLVTNGSFETPVQAVGGLEDFVGGSTDIPGWTVQGVDVNVINQAYAEPANGMVAFNSDVGAQCLDLTGYGNTGPTNGVIQTIATTPGVTYNLTFAVGAGLTNNGSPYYPAIAATDDLSVNGGSTIPFTSFPTDPGYMTWTEYSYPFVASGATTTIDFFNGTPTQDDFSGLDNVQVVVPEPTTGILLLGVGSGMLLTRGRRQLIRV
jgi:hypothetical protein